MAVAAAAQEPEPTACAVSSVGVNVGYVFKFWGIRAGTTLARAVVVRERRSWGCEQGGSTTIGGSFLGLPASFQWF